MSNEDSKKYAYSVILIAASLIAVKAGISSQSEIKIPQTSVAVPVYSLWLALIFLYIPYLRELSKNNIRPIHIWKKSLDTQLCKWSRLYVKEKWPDYIAPLIKTEYLGKLSWSHVYHQAGKNTEPSYKAVSKPFNTIMLAIFAFFSVFFKLRILELLTVPLALSLTALGIWVMALW